ncbi:hypothetical protein ABZ747_23520, partial [Kitasatospora cineracea]
RRQLGELDNAVGTRAGRTFLAEQYTGWPAPRPPPPERTPDGHPRPRTRTAPAPAFPGTPKPRRGCRQPNG